MDQCKKPSQSAHSKQTGVDPEDICHCNSAAGTRQQGIATSEREHADACIPGFPQPAGNLQPGNTSYPDNATVDIVDPTLMSDSESMGWSYYDLRDVNGDGFVLSDDGQAYHQSWNSFLDFDCALERIPDGVAIASPLGEVFAMQELDGYFDGQCWLDVLSTPCQWQHGAS